VEKIIEKVRKTLRIIGWLIGICFIFYFTGCRTIAITDNDILEHQRRIATLEARIVDYERRITEYDNLIGGTVARLEIIRSRAAGITDRADRIIFLFDEYEREVNRLIDSFNRDRGEITQSAKNKLLALVRYYSDVGIEDWSHNPWFR
jgi:hypothetical protein